MAGSEAPKENTEKQDSNSKLESIIKDPLSALGELMSGKLDLKKLLDDILKSLGGEKDKEKKDDKKDSTPATSTDGAPTQDYLLNKLFGGKEGKAVQYLTIEQREALGKKVFGDGPGAKLLIALDKKYGGKGEMILRMIALGKHEGALLFGRTNPDPASGSNRGTFQIGGVASTAETTKSKYDTMLALGAKIYQETLGETVDTAKLNNADKDLIAHIGYIQERSNMFEKNPTAIFAKLGDPKLADSELVSLMHYKIQGGIADIGQNVLAMTRKGTLKVNLDELTA